MNDDLISREAAGHDREELIREKLKDITIVKQDGKYRPVKNTSSQECYRVIYEINRLLNMKDDKEANND
jgi:hypothetical protein